MLCCSLPRTTLFAASVVCTGVCIWMLVPWEATVSKLIPTFNRTIWDIKQIPHASDKQASYVFSQCEKETWSAGLCCNGLTSNCDLRITEVLFATLHNAMNAAEVQFVGSSYNVSLEEPLRAGYRGLLLSVCDCSVEGDSIDLRLCDGSCSEFTRSMTDFLSEIVSFLVSNNGEVLIVNFQMPNEDVAYSNALYEFITAVDGFDQLLYEQPSDEIQWPLMRDLVLSGKRIIIFLRNGSNCNEIECPKGFHMFNDHVSQTQSYFKTAEEILDFDLSCQIAVGAPQIPIREFFLVNHFITEKRIDEKEHLTITKKVAIEDRLVACSELNGYSDVNMLAIDFLSYSEVPMVVQEHNIARAALTR